MNAKSGLRLISYDPNDYAIGEVLRSESGKVIDDMQAISSALSLYFQWPEHSEALVLIPNESSEATYQFCTIDYDRDEARATELRLKLQPGVQFSKQTVPSIQIRFVVFGCCYEFVAPIMARSSHPETDGWNLICDIPKSLFVHKMRRLPRVLMSSGDKNLLPVFYLVYNEKRIILNILEIGLRSIAVSSIAEVQNDAVAKVEFSGTSVSAKIVRLGPEKAVVSLHFEDPVSFGIYFDLFKAVRYPHVFSRREFDKNKTFKIYQESGYLESFSDEDTELLKEKVLITWENILMSEHIQTVDFFSTDSNKEPVGAASIAQAFYLNDKPVWVFHQMCSLKAPEYFSQTRDLYRWRAEYLAARPEDSVLVVTFKSASRWNERMFVKFIQERVSESKLISAQCYRITVPKKDKVTTNHADCWVKKEVGPYLRVMSNSTTYMAGIYPTYWNASRGLDEIIAIDPAIGEEEVQQIADGMCKAAAAESIQIRVFISADIAVKQEFGVKLPSDRVCIIPKNEYMDFLRSVEHTIAVTEKKFLKGYEVEVD